MSQTPPEPLEQAEVVESISEPVAEPEPVINEPVAPLESVVNEPAVHKVPTNEELIKQHGFDNFVGHAYSLGLLMEAYPQYFTDAHREKAFQYIYDLGMVLNGGADVQFKGASGLFMLDLKLKGWTYKGKLDPVVWMKFGEIYGVDTTYWEGI